MKKNGWFILVLVVLAVLFVSSASYAACPAGWSCNTKISVSGNTTTCKATVTGPGSFYISMWGGGTGGKALHLGSTYYGNASTNYCPNASSCSVTYTYTGSARPNLCNWLFSY